MLRDISSMANAEGGALVVGIDEDGEDAAQRLMPVPDAEMQANRIIASCSANIAERIPGLQARPVPIGGGFAIVVRVPRSYRKPHMITFGGVTDFWVGTTGRSPGCQSPRSGRP
jgi:predicted HTH transcriptional regulator